METNISTTKKLSPEAACTPAAKFFDVDQCATRYGFSVEHWRRLVDAGKAPQPRRFGRLVRWAATDLDAWDADGNQPVRSMNPPARSGKGGAE